MDHLTGSNDDAGVSHESPAEGTLEESLSGFSSALEAFNDHVSMDRAPIGFSVTMASFSEMDGLISDECSIADRIEFSFS
jgi:hypothetical protein